MKILEFIVELRQCFVSIPLELNLIKISCKKTGNSYQLEGSSFASNHTQVKKRSPAIAHNCPQNIMMREL